MISHTPIRMARQQGRVWLDADDIALWLLDTAANTLDGQETNPVAIEVARLLRVLSAHTLTIGQR